jgi:FixJ family two-component response regulator
MNDKPRILFVDDEENVLRAIRRHFLDEDYEIITANSGRAGLVIMRQAPADVIVSDFRMPEMSGGEFLSQVADQWPETVRMVLSGYADISAVISAINDGGIYRFISKPWQENELKEAVSDALVQHRSMVQLRNLADQALSVNETLLEDERRESARIHQRNVDLEQQVQFLELYREAFLASACPAAIVRLDEPRVTLNNGFRDLIISETEDLSLDDFARVAPHLVDDAQRVHNRLAPGQIEYRIALDSQPWSASFASLGYNEAFRALLIVLRRP